MDRIDALLEDKLLRAARLEIEVLEAIAALPHRRATVPILGRMMPSVTESTIRHCLLRQKGVCVAQITPQLWQLIDEPDDLEPVEIAPNERYRFPAILEKYLCQQTGAHSVQSFNDRLLLLMPFDGVIEVGDGIKYKYQDEDNIWCVNSAKVRAIEWRQDHWYISTGISRVVRRKLYPENVIGKTVPLLHSIDLSQGLLAQLKAVKGIDTSQFGHQSRTKALGYLVSELPWITEEELVLLEAWWNPSMIKVAQDVRKFASQQDWEDLCIAQRYKLVRAKFGGIAPCYRMLYHPNFKELQKQ